MGAVRRLGGIRPPGPDCRLHRQVGGAHGHDRRPPLLPGRHHPPAVPRLEGAHGRGEPPRAQRPALQLARGLGMQTHRGVLSGALRGRLQAMRIHDDGCGHRPREAVDGLQGPLSLRRHSPLEQEAVPEGRRFRAASPCARALAHGHHIRARQGASLLHDHHHRRVQPVHCGMGALRDHGGGRRGDCTAKSRGGVPAGPSKVRHGQREAVCRKGVQGVHRHARLQPCDHFRLLPAEQRQD